MGWLNNLISPGPGEQPTEPRSLPQAMRDLQAGLIEYPRDPLGELDDGPIQVRRVPQPEPYVSWHHHLEMYQRAERREKAENDFELAVALRAKEMTATNPDEIRRLQEAQAQLRNGDYDVERT
jgi:hypothetical protein